MRTIRLTKVKSLLFSGLIIIISTLFACSDESAPDDTSDCSTPIIIDKKLYSSTLTNNYTITRAKLDDNCLAIEITSSGCDGDSWEAMLYDSGEVSESYPIQRFLRLLLINTEECDAVITKLFHFDLTPIKDDAENAILNIEGWDNSLLFE